MMITKMERKIKKTMPESKNFSPSFAIQLPKEQRPRPLTIIIIKNNNNNNQRTTDTWILATTTSNLSSRNYPQNSPASSSHEQLSSQHCPTTPQFSCLRLPCRSL